MIGSDEPVIASRQHPRRCRYFDCFGCFDWVLR